jgi:predicted dehydrogenase
MPIAIALLGCAHPHVSDLLGVIASEPDLRLAAAWDEDGSAIPGLVSQHAVREATTAIDRADAVVICAPTDLRPRLCMQAATAGRPILVEKPIARTAAEAVVVAREMRRSRTPAMAAMYLRELPALARLRGLLASGVLGRLSSATASWLHAGALDGSFVGPRAWMRDPRRAGVGALGDLAIPLVDALAVLGGAPVLTAVSFDRGPVGGGDLGGTAVGRWADVPLSVRTSWATRPAALELAINGAAASAVVREGTLELVRADGSRERWVGAPPDAGEALRAFAARLRARRLTTRELDAAIAAQTIVERAAVLD